MDRWEERSSKVDLTGFGISSSRCLFVRRLEILKESSGNLTPLPSH